MADITKNINIKVNTNSDEVQREFEDLRKSIKETEKEIDALSKEFGENSKEADAARKSLAALNVAYDKLSKDAVDLGASFEDINGEVKPLTAQLGELEDRLYALALAGQTNTDEFALLTAEAGRYRQAQIQTDLAVDSAAKTVASKLGGALQGAAGAFAVAQGAAGLFGKENEQVEQALLKVQSALALVQGIQAFKEGIPDIKNFAKSLGGAVVGVRNAIASLGLFGKAQKAAAIEARGLSAATKEAAASETQAGVAGAAAGTGIFAGFSLATIATTAFAAALSAAGIGLIFAGITAAVEFFSSAFASASEKSAEKAEETSERLGAAQDKAAAEYQGAADKIAQIDLTGGSKKKAYDQLVKEAQEYHAQTIKSQEEADRRLLELDAELKAARKKGDDDEAKELQKKYNEQVTLAQNAKNEVVNAKTQEIKDKQARDRNAFAEENKGLKQQIDAKKAAGQTTLALQIEYKQKELEAAKKFNSLTKEEQEQLNNDIIALQKSLADEQRANFEKAVAQRKATSASITAVALAEIENQKATALAAAKTDEERFKVEQQFFKKTQEAKLVAINTQEKLDKSLAKTSAERLVIERNAAAARLALQTEEINQTEKNNDTTEKLALDALNKQAKVLQEKVKLEGASFNDRITLQLKQNEIELATLEKGGEEYNAVVKRQGEELIKLKKDLKAKELAEEQTVGDLAQEIANSKALLELKQKEGETLAEFQQRRTEFAKEQSRKRVEDENADLQAQLDQTITYTKDGVEVTEKVIKEGSKEELSIKKKMVENSKDLYDEDVQNKLDAEEEKLAGIEKLINDSMALLGEAAAFAQAMLEAETKRIEEEAEKRSKAEQARLDKRLENEELTESQRAELQRQSALEQAKIEEEKQAKIKEIQKKQADIDLAITISEIIANTALAFIRGFSDLGPIGGGVFAAIFAATSAAQIATAIAQRNAIQGLALGGMVYGAGGPTDDLVPIMASNGEAVINAKAVQKFAPVLSAINESTGGAPIRPKFAVGGVVSATPGEVTVSNINDIAAVAGTSAVRAYILDADVTSQSVKNARLVRDARIK